MRKAILIPNMIVAVSACGAAAVMPPPQDDPLITALHDIQGNGASSPLEGREVRVRGIVTGDFQCGDTDTQNSLGGFFLQEEIPDGDPATSDGVFVHDGNAPSVDVEVGDRVAVDGTVMEYFGETQISARRVEVTGTGAIAETSISLPAEATIRNADGDLIADLERFEGMLVRFPGAMTVTRLSDLGRYGEMLISDGGRPVHLTNEYPPDVAGYSAHLAAVAARRLMLDDGLSIQDATPVRYLDPPIRVGDTVSNLTGTIRFSRGSGKSGTEIYRLVPTIEPSFRSVNPRPAAPPDVGGALKIASFNLQNYFTTIDRGPKICGPSGDSNCRGADSREEFDRQHVKIVNALLQLDADIIGLVELENNGNVSIQSLRDGLNAVAGAGSYAIVETGTIGSDAIRVGFLYRPASVSTTGPYAVIGSLVDQRFDDSRNRPSLAQSFRRVSNGAVMTVAMNHLKSKGSDCSIVGDPDRNDGQGNCNITRADAAAALADWLASDPTASGDRDVLIIGDLNAYLQEDPVTALEAAGFHNLLESYVGAGGYSFTFDGRAGALDHALASPGLAAQVTGVAEWHINADEAPVRDYNLDYGRDPDAFDRNSPYRASDHDPIVVGLDLED